MVTLPEKELITIRVPRKLGDELRSVATREGETQSTIVRRLIRRGLESEQRRREDHGDEAA
jgi:hypothetical protein